MTVTVGGPGDWGAVEQIGGPVVDPLILRCGELFLRGAKGVADVNAAADLLTRNIHAVGTFFDRLILDEKIPVFNYADTFDRGQNFDTGTLSRVNTDAKEEVLVYVDVQYWAYTEVKRGAVAELKKLYDGTRPGIDRTQAYNILGELTASGYAWYPEIPEIALPNDDERRLAGYILGGLIFGGYAQLAARNHFMQPKRSRLFLAISLGQDTSREGEERIFEELGKLTGRPVAEVPYTPTFFPLLLKGEGGPAGMLKEALELRKSGEVRDYRAWLNEALIDFKRDGRISIERRREVDKIANSIRKKMEGFPFPKVEIKTSIADVAALGVPVPGIDLTPPLEAGWGWMIEQLPGKRHRKLLTRAVMADIEYDKIDRRMQTVWGGTGVGS